MGKSKKFVPVNHLIVKAFKEAAPEIPCSHIRYSGKSKEYALFSFTSRIPKHFYSGDQNMLETYGFIDLFTVSDPSVKGSITEKIEKALEDNGVWVGNITEVGYDEKIGLFHIEFEIRIYSRLIRGDTDEYKEIRRR